ncbi:MAG: hypothetical protein JWL75_220 [Parcubacteria group bacterium]|nr:hypothetical protein [Parcubacteria group bacterium]
MKKVEEKVRAYKVLARGIPLLTPHGVAAWTTIHALLKETRDTHSRAYNDGSAVGGIGKIDVRRELENANRRLREAEFVLGNYRAIDPADDTSVVDVGTTITTSNGGKVPITVQVGDYGSDDPTASPPIVSYTSRLILGLLGSKIGDAAFITLATGEEQDVDILDIQLSEKKPVDKPMPETVTVDIAA